MDLFHQQHQQASPHTRFMIWIFSDGIQDLDANSQTTESIPFEKLDPVRALPADVDIVLINPRRSDPVQQWKAVSQLEVQQARRYVATLPATVNDRSQLQSLTDVLIKQLLVGTANRLHVRSATCTIQEDKSRRAANIHGTWTLENRYLLSQVSTEYTAWWTHTGELEPTILTCRNGGGRLFPTPIGRGAAAVVNHDYHCHVRGYQNLPGEIQLRYSVSSGVQAGAWPEHSLRLTVPCRVVADEPFVVLDPSGLVQIGTSNSPFQVDFNARYPSPPDEPQQEAPVYLNQTPSVPSVGNCRCRVEEAEFVNLPNGPRSGTRVEGSFTCQVEHFDQDGWIEKAFWRVFPNPLRIQLDPGGAPAMVFPGQTGNALQAASLPFVRIGWISVLLLYLHWLFSVILLLWFPLHRRHWRVWLVTPVACSALFLVGFTGNELSLEPLTQVPSLRSLLGKHVWLLGATATLASGYALDSRDPNI